MRPLRYALLSALPLLVIFIAVAFLDPKGKYWGNPESPAVQCEACDAARLRTMTTPTAEVYDPRKLDRMVREPQNTISNLGYMVVGLAILFASYQPASRGLGSAALFLTVGSAFYHVTLLPEWSFINLLGVYAVLFNLVLVGATAHVDWLKRGRWRWPITVLVWALAIYAGARHEGVRWLGLPWFDSADIFIAAVAAIGLLAWAARRKAKDPKRFARAAGVLVGATLIALVGELGDRFGSFWANPDAIIQGHAVWHLFGGIAILAAYEVFALTGFDHSTLYRPQYQARSAD